MTGVDQILCGGATDIFGHSIIRSTIKKLVKVGDRTFVWIEIGNSKLFVNQIVTFEDNCPVQIDQWAGVDAKTNRIVPYETVRTVWSRMNGEERLPVTMYGIRRHKVRPAEFIFRFVWTTGKDVESKLFDPQTVGKTSVSGL